MEHGSGEIDALIREEKRLTAIESQTEAWAEGLSAMTTAFEELLRSCNEDIALGLIEKIREKVISGEFEHARSCH
jgi:hypothetical protein